MSSFSVLPRTLKAENTRSILIDICFICNYKQEALGESQGPPN